MSTFISAIPKTQYDYCSISNNSISIDINKLNKNCQNENLKKGITSYSNSQFTNNPNVQNGFNSIPILNVLTSVEGNNGVQESINRSMDGNRCNTNNNCNAHLSYFDYFTNKKLDLSNSNKSNKDSNLKKMSFSNTSFSNDNTPSFSENPIHSQNVNITNITTINITPVIIHNGKGSTMSENKGDKTSKEK